MSLLDILHTGRSGLGASQLGIQTVGRNVTNAQVEGYNVRNVVLAPAVPSILGGRGVEVSALVRASDPMLFRTLLSDRGDASSAEARTMVLAPVVTSFAELDTEGLGAALDALWTAFRQLEARPDDLDVRREVLDRVDGLAAAFRAQASTIQRERSSADDRVRDHAARLDELGFQIAELNEEIAVAVTTGGGQELMDRRDALVREVSTIIDTRVISHDDGTITLVVASGIALVDGRDARHVRIDPGSAPGRAEVQVEGAGLWTDINDRIGGGALEGLIAARDGDLDAIEDRLDQLAFDLATATNAVHVAGFGSDGLGGRFLFAPLAGPAGAASAIAISAMVAGDPAAVAAAAAPGLAGDNRNALALAALSSTDIAAGGTATAAEEHAALVGQAAATARQAEDQAANLEAARAQTQNLWEQRVGVSVDEEMVDMIAYEKAYQAAAKLVALADDLYDTLLAMKKV
jgi:flagellar hook-associated protein 1 FlgK